MDNKKSTLSGSGALRRGLRVLDALGQAETAGLKVAEISRLLDMPRPTVYRVLDVLVAEGWVQAFPDERRFVLTRPPATGKSGAWDALINRMTPALRRIAAVTGNSAFLIRRADDDSLCLHREVGTYPVQVLAISVRGRQPLGVGAAGMALLAALPEDDIAEVLQHNAPILHKYGGMTAQIMRTLIGSTQARGYSVVGNYAVPGILGVGVAVHDKYHRPVAGVSVSSIVDRMSAQQQRSIASLIRESLESLSQA